MYFSKVRDHFKTGLNLPFAMIAGAVIMGMTVLTIFAPLPAKAGDEVFVVQRIFVNAQAESATAAKVEAVKTGRRKAMDLLLRRLVPERDWDYLPKLEANQPANIGDAFGGSQSIYDKSSIVLDDAALEELGQGFEVYEEKSSPTTYRANITYRFKPAQTRSLLIAARIPYSEAQTRTALIIPVLETQRGLYLWEQNNPWLNAWQAKPLANELTPLVAPLGDLEDSASITAKQALGINQDKLEKLANRYGVPQVIIAHARLSVKDGTDTLRIRLLSGYRESGSLAPNEALFPSSNAVNGIVTGAQRSLGSSGAGLPHFNSHINGAVDGSIIGEPGEVLSESWLSQPSGQFPVLADLAIVKSVNTYAAGWKAQTLIDHSISSVLQASAFFESLSEWKQIRSALISTPLVASVQVRNLSRGGAELSIRSFGDPGKLVVAMESQGLSLWTLEQGVVTDVVWNIATPATAAKIPARLQSAPINDRSRSIRTFSDNGGFGANNKNYAQPTSGTSSGLSGEPQGNGFRTDDVRGGGLTNQAYPQGQPLAPTSQFPDENKIESPYR